MTDALKTATSALLKTADAFNRTANNIANVHTRGYPSKEGQPSGVRLEKEIVDIVHIEHAHSAALKVVDATEKMRQELLEIGRNSQRK